MQVTARTYNVIKIISVSIPFFVRDRESRPCTIGMIGKLPQFVGFIAMVFLILLVLDLVPFLL